MLLGEDPPPYSPLTSPESGSAPVISCRVCQSLISVEGKIHQHVVKCGVCNEATVGFLCTCMTTCSTHSLFMHFMQLQHTHTRTNTWPVSSVTRLFHTKHIFSHKPLVASTHLGVWFYVAQTLRYVFLRFLPLPQHIRGQCNLVFGAQSNENTTVSVSRIRILITLELTVRSLIVPTIPQNIFLVSQPCKCTVHSI